MSKNIEVPVDVGDVVWAESFVSDALIPFTVSTMRVYKLYGKRCFCFEALYYEDDNLIDEIQFDNNDIASWVFLDE